jgi:TetR/AcrR family transcriptional regulator, mexJK operon transcriptional repressor
MQINSNRSKLKQEKRQRILDAALKIFSTAGFAGAAMDAIAAEADVSKPTLYTYFGSKEKLFEALLVAGRDDMLASFEQPSGDLVSDLYNFAWRYADLVMRPEYLSLARLIIGEAHRFASIGLAYQKAGPDRVLKGMMVYLLSMRANKALHFEDAELAAQDLWALILSAPRNKALHIPTQIPRRKDIRRYVENGLRVFLAAYSENPAQDIKKLKLLCSP